MKTSKAVSSFLLTLSLVLFFNCTTTNEHSESNIDLKEKTRNTSKENQRAQTLKILPLGDSRVEGATTNSVSYRYYLWDLLVHAGFNFDFIGTQNDNTNYPPTNSRFFDPDHQGIGGFRTTNVLANIDDVADTVDKPDIVLLGIGGNDLIHGTSVEEVVENIKIIIIKLRLINPKVTILLEQIAPANSNLMTSSNTIIYNDFITEIGNLATSINTSHSKVIAVDMSSNWSDSYLADNLHYNHQGAKEVGLRYYLAFKEHIF